MVFTLISLSFTIAEQTMTAISEAGIFSSFFGQRISIASEITPIRSACQLIVSINRPIAFTFSTVSIGDSKPSFSCIRALS